MRGAEVDGFTKEELIFSAINHDLGKMGDENHESYIPQTDKWRREKLGEDYMFNTQLAFASVPDRGLYMLQSHGIQYSFNEMVAIQTHDGLYDEANNKYLKTYLPEQKFRNPLPIILHQADLMAAYIEFRREMGSEIGQKEKPKTDNFTLNTKTTSTKTKALGSVGSEGLANIFDKL